MTETEFLDLISTRTSQDVLDQLSRMPAKDRRAFAKPAMKLFKTFDRFWGLNDGPDDVTVLDQEALTVAVLATASGSELKKLAFFPRPDKPALIEIIRALDPDWTQSVVDHFVEQRVFYVRDFQPLWKAGLCTRPDSDAIILSYYSYWTELSDEDEKVLLETDVWRFFEVEGGGEDSLANHDKYIKSHVDTWADRLKQYADQGKLDRQRLLDASLDALERDFGQYRAGWYSRFHVHLEPTQEELAARSDRYLRLLASSIPPTVSFALKHVQILEKAGALDAVSLVQALEAPLQARAKGTVTTALKLLQRAAKRAPDYKSVAAEKAALALISEDSGVQGKALDAVEAMDLASAAPMLGDYVDLVAPSVRPRILELTGASAEVAPEPEMTAAPIKPAVPTPIVPVSTAAEALALFLKVLEDPRDPFEVERAMDGLSRFGIDLRKDETMLSPLRKRANQICKNPGESDLRSVLALTGRGLCDGTFEDLLKNESGTVPSYNYVSRQSLQEFHLVRNGALLKRLGAGVSAPLLSLPSDTSGQVSTGDLMRRMDAYRAAGHDPDPRDLALALMRLSVDGDSAADLPNETEADRALAYAKGADVPVGPRPALWAAAWCARKDRRPDTTVSKLFKQPTPNCGLPAEMSVEVKKTTSDCGNYHWVDVEAPSVPANTLQTRALPALFGAVRKGHFGSICTGHTFADVAWASLTWPGHPEPFFRMGILHQDTWQKLSDNHTRAYLEPFFRPGPNVGPLGAAVLAYYMACEDKSVTSLAVEALVAVAAEGRLSSDDFALALRPFLMSGALPTARWTKAMKAVSDLGSGSFARDVIVRLLNFDPEDMPRDIGGMLELCYELHLAEGARFDNETARQCLASLKAGGKVARFSKKLLEMPAESR